MGNWKRFFSSKHLDSGDIPDGGKPLIKIVSVGDGDTAETDGEKKMLVTFQPGREFATAKRTWLCAKTIGYQLEAMFGPDPEQWRGKIVAVYSAPIRDGEAVRIWGSPQIKRDVTIKVREFGGGRKTWTMRAMQATGAAPQGAPPVDIHGDKPPPVDAMPEPGSDG